MRRRLKASKAVARLLCEMDRFLCAAALAADAENKPRIVAYIEDVQDRINRLINGFEEEL